MLIDISIINYFDKGLSWETLVEGFFITNVFMVSTLFLMYLLPEFHKVDESFIDFYFREIKAKMRTYFSSSIGKESDLLGKVIKFVQLVSFSSTLIIISFIVGIIFSNVSDSFMDQNNHIHLGLKKNWTTLNSSKNLKNTDEGIKIDVFDKIFGKNCLEPKAIKQSLNKLNRKSTLKVEHSGVNSETRIHIIKDLYYNSKHRILESEKWSTYLESTQKLINLNQTFCFGFWILIIISFIGFIVTLIMSFKDRINNSESKHSKTELIFLATMTATFVANIFAPINWNAISLYTTIGFLLTIMILIQFRRIHGFRLTTSLMLLIVSIFLYYITAIAWDNCEIESCSKVYGLLIHMDSDLNSISTDILKKSLD